MPENCRKFWEALPENLDCEDLSVNLEYLKNNYKDVISLQNQVLFDHIL